MSVTENPQREYGDQTLQQFGYRQEFRRELKRFASFAIGFLIHFNYDRNLHDLWLCLELGWAVRYLDMAYCHCWSAFCIACLRRASVAFTSGRLFVPVDFTTGKSEDRLACRMDYIHFLDCRCGSCRLCDCAGGIAEAIQLHGNCAKCMDSNGHSDRDTDVANHFLHVVVVAYQ